MKIKNFLLRMLDPFAPLPADDVRLQWESRSNPIWLRDYIDDIARDAFTEITSLRKVTEDRLEAFADQIDELSSRLDGFQKKETRTKKKALASVGSNNVGI